MNLRGGGSFIILLDRGVLDHVEQRWGGVAGYLEAAGVTPDNIDRLSCRLA